MGNTKKLRSEVNVGGRPPTVFDADNPSETQQYTPSNFESPKQIGRFEVLRHVGQGGMGDVFEAIDQDLYRRVAIKMPRADATRDIETRNRLIREARLMAGLSHRNLVQVYEWGVWNGQWFMVSQWAPCGDLAACLSNRAGLRSNVNWCVDVIRQLASALATCHENNIVHLDIKPANIVFEHSRSDADRVADCVETALNLPTHPLLTDFGLARVLEFEGNQTITSTGLGTPSYMAPEQFAGQEHKIGPQTDIFSLGVVMHELLYGVRPFEGRTAVAMMDNMRANRRSTNTQHSHVPKPLQRICQRCLEFDPDDRYPSAARLHDDLQAFASKETVCVPRPSKIKMAQRWCEQKVRVRDAGMLALWMQGALCVSLVLLVALKLFGLARSVPSPLSTLSADVGLILAFPTIPCVILGFFTVANHRWAFSANIALSLAFVGMLVSVLATHSSPLTFYNDNPLAFLIGHLIILTLACIQLGAHLVAIPALRGIAKAS